MKKSKTLTNVKLKGDSIQKKKVVQFKMYLYQNQNQRELKNSQIYKILFKLRTHHYQNIGGNIN